MGKSNAIERRAKAEGLTEKKLLIKLIEAGNNQKDIAAKLGVSQAAVSTAFGRNNIRPVIRYEYDPEVA